MQLSNYTQVIKRRIFKVLHALDRALKIWGSKSGMLPKTISSGYEKFSAKKSFILI